MFQRTSYIQVQIKKPLSMVKNYYFFLYCVSTSDKSRFISSVDASREVPRMCRLVVYKGVCMPLEDILIKPANSLVYQSDRGGSGSSLIPGLPESLQMPMNVDGAGIAWYDENQTPKRYRCPIAARMDYRLLDVSREARSGLVFGHVRSAAAGVTGENAAAVDVTNCHPFTYKAISFMHNGAVSGFCSIRPQLEAMLNEESAAIVQGKTDSEICFALFLTLLGDLSVSHSSLDLADALDRTIGVITRISKASNITHASSLNFAVTNGVHVAVSRYRNSRKESQQPPSLYINYRNDYNSSSYKCLHRDLPKQNGSVIIASEPLNTHNLDCWSIVPKNTIIIVNSSSSNHSRVEDVQLRPVRHGVDIEDFGSISYQMTTSSSLEHVADHAVGSSTLSTLINGTFSGSSSVPCL